jgi:PKD repeat protein
MRPAPSLSRRCALLIVIASPALLGFFRCVVISSPSVATASIDRLEPTTPRVGDIVQVTGSGNGTPPLEFAWDFGDGARSVGAQAAHAYTAPGSYRLMLTVRDSFGNFASDAAQVVVSARIPSSMISLVSDAVADQPVVFAASELEENAGALTHTWTFSDGQSAIGSQVAATFPMAGMYLASVTVTSDLGAMAVTQMAFEVVAAVQ